MTARRTSWSRACLAACVLVAIGGMAVAQIDLINHRQWAWVQLQRRELLDVTLPLDAAGRARVAAALVECEEGVPLLTLGRALTAARGKVPGADALFRSGLQLFAMPEVIDPAAMKSLAVTVYAPHVQITGDLPMPRQYAFEIDVRDAAGALVQRGTFDDVPDFRALREFRVTHDVPVEALPEGEYEVTVRTVLEGRRGPRSADLVTTFAVLPGYKERAGFFRVDAPESPFLARLGKLDPVGQAILRGAGEFATRAFFGLPGVHPSTAVRDLRRAERLLENLEKGAPVFEGLAGFLHIALPGRPRELIFVSPRLPAEGLPKRGSPAWQALEKRPLVLFFGRVPTFDVRGRRPSAPRFAVPAYVAAELERVGFDAAGEFQVVCVESLGRVRGHAEQVQRMLPELRKLVPFDAGRMVLVGDVHGAAAAVDVALRHPEQTRGLALFNTAGGLATPQLKQLGHVHVELFRGRGHSGGRQIELTRGFAGLAGKTKGFRIHDVELPWSIGLPLMAEEIAGIVRSCTAR